MCCSVPSNSIIVILGNRFESIAVSCNPLCKSAYKDKNSHCMSTLICIENNLVP